MPEGALGWTHPPGAHRLHWFDTRAGDVRSACRRYLYQESLPLQSDEAARANSDRRCWECSTNRCPTGDHPLGTCPGDHGK